MKYNATSQSDLNSLADRVSQLSIKQYRWLAANAILRQLMIDPVLEKWQRVAATEHNLPQERIDQGMMFLWQNLEPREVKSFIDELCRHMVEGADDTTAESVGGFNQTELDAFVELVDLVERTGDG